MLTPETTRINRGDRKMTKRPRPLNHIRRASATLGTHRIGKPQHAGKQDFPVLQEERPKKKKGRTLKTKIVKDYTDQTNQHVD
jgi:hypothetical protein